MMLASGTGLAPIKPMIECCAARKITYPISFYWGCRARDFMNVTDTSFKPDNCDSVVKPLILSHGTFECRNMKESGKFYEEILGLECVRHALPAMHARCKIKFSIASVEFGADVRPLGMLNHWGLDVESREEVDAAYNAAIEMEEKYKIGEVTKPTMRHGIYPL